MALRIIVVGCGSIGKRHLGNLKALGVENLVAVDTRKDRLQEVTERIGSEILCSDNLSEQLKSKCDGVVVCVPTSIHLDVAKEAIKSGASVLIEKPLSNTSEGVPELLSLAKESSLVVAVGYTYRFWPALQKIKYFLENDQIGQIYSANIIFSEYLPDWHPWEDYRSWFMAKKELGGGALLDESHAIDIMRWLFGEARTIYGVNGTFSKLEIDSDDLAEIIVRFHSGVIGSIHMDIYGRHHRKELSIQGELGNIYWDFYKNTVALYQANLEKWEVIQFEDDRNDMFLNEVRHWLNAIQGGPKVPVDGYDALKTLSFALAANESSMNDKVVEPFGAIDK